jgi:hypothetical protein
VRARQVLYHWATSPASFIFQIMQTKRELALLASTSHCWVPQSLE